jgi:hypothetical protein
LLASRISAHSAGARSGSSSNRLEEGPVVGEEARRRHRLEEVGAVLEVGGEAPARLGDEERQVELR